MGFTTSEHHECVAPAGTIVTPATTSTRDPAAVTLPASPTTPAAPTLEPGTTVAAVTLPASRTMPAAPTFKPGTTVAAVTLPASLTAPAAPTFEPVTTATAWTLPASLTTSAAPTVEPATTAAARTLPASATTAVGAPSGADAAHAAALLVQRRGQDCWDECRKKSGTCGWCGSSAACCRKGFADAPECDGTTGFTTTEHHECVALAGTIVTPATTLAPEIAFSERSTAAPASTTLVTTAAASPTLLLSQDGEYSGDDCWDKCGGKAGSCPDFCGDGKVCCREAWPSDPAECKGATGFKAFTLHHQCVAAAGTVSTTLVGAATTVATGGVAASTLPPFLIATTAADPGSALAQSTTPLPFDNSTDANESRRNLTNQTPVIVGAVSGDSGGIPVWVWPLLLLCLLCCIPLLLYLLGCCEGRRKKRSARKSGKAKRPDSAEDSFASPLASETEVQPLVRGQDRGSAAQGQGPDLFDLMDRDHDGVVSPAEFGVAMGLGPAALRAVRVAVPQLTAPTRQPLLTTAVPQPMVPQVMAAPQAMAAPQPMAVQLAAPGAHVQPGALMGAVRNPHTVAPCGANVQQILEPPHVPGVAGRVDLFDLMDRNHDGIVSASEFSRAMAPQAHFRPQ